MVLIVALIGAVFAFIAGAESGTLNEGWWDNLNTSALPYISLSVVFFVLAGAASVNVKSLSTPWRYELLMLGATVTFGLSVLYAATHPERIDVKLFTLMSAQAVAAFILVILFLVMKSNRSWKLAMPALLLFFACAGFFGYALLG